LARIRCEKLRVYLVCVSNEAQTKPGWEKNEVSKQLPCLIGEKIARMEFGQVNSNRCLVEHIEKVVHPCKQRGRQEQRLIVDMCELHLSIYKQN
jgi:hypothetical protein